MRTRSEAEVEHAAELASERLRLAEAGEREKQAAIDDLRAVYSEPRSDGSIAC